MKLLKNINTDFTITFTGKIFSFLQKNIPVAILSLREKLFKRYSHAKTKSLF